MLSPCVDAMIEKRPPNRHHGALLNANQPSFLRNSEMANSKGNGRK